MTKVFLKDMLDKKTLRKYILIWIFLYIGLNYLIGKNPSLLDINLSLNFIFFVDFTLISTIYFFIKSYAKSDKIIFYYALAYQRKQINLSLLFSLVIDTILKRISIIFIFLFIIKADFILYLYVLLSSILISSLGLILNATNIDKNKKLLFEIFHLLTIISPYFWDKFIKSSEISRLLYFFEILLLIIGTSEFIFKDMIVNSKNKIITRKLKIPNYFLKFILAEKIYLINSFAIIIFIIAISIFMPKPINIPLSLAVATINSPLLSIFSTEKSLNNYEKMLPNKYVSLSRQYLFLLTIYFLSVNFLVLILNYKVFTMKFLILVILISLLDIIISYILEKKFQISEKKTDMAVWKSPRKYLLSILVFLISFIIIVII